MTKETLQNFYPSVGGLNSIQLHTKGTATSTPMCVCECVCSCRLTPVASGGSPLDSAALDSACGSFVQIHSVLHYRWKLGLDLRCTDTLLKEF